MTVSAATIRRSGRPNGWWGMTVFVAAEATLIGTIVGSYVYLRINSATWPPHGTPRPDVVLPVVLTAMLVATLAPFQLALAAARRGDRGRACGLLAFATAGQAAYLAVQIHLFSDSLTRFTPQSSAYASAYYVLLGAGHAHVAVGLLFDLWLLLRISVRLTPYRLAGLEAVALYWWVVAGLTVIITLTALSPRL